MPEARLLIGIATLGGLLVIGLLIFIVERRHSGRNRHRGPERLPLFGTEQLAIRTSDGYEDAAHEAPAAMPARPFPPRVMPSSNGRPATRPIPSAPPHVEPPRAPTPPAPALAIDPLPVPAAAAGPSTAPRASDFAPRTQSVRPAPPPVMAMPTQEYVSPSLRPAGTATSEAPAPKPAESAASAVDAALIDGETLRFTLPVDGTVEFLPGHLEVVAGPDSGKEIRFVRAPNDTADVEVTFGRSEGPPHRHIQILARTVSRRHAVMSLIDDHWQLTNLSSTNPLVLNGRVLAGDEVAPLLVEGDRIEMGEVVFVYHDG